MAEHLTQPANSTVCGQVCVAIAAGMSLEEAIKLIGHSRGTHTQELRRAFAKLGILSKDKKLKRWNGKDKPPTHALVHALFHKKGEPFAGHWLLNWDGILHDPAQKTAGVVCSGARLTSYLELIPPGAHA